MESKNISISFSLTSTLTIIFVLLKAFKVISWSWLWVLSPLWISLSIGSIFLVFAVILAVLLVKRNDE